MPIGSRSQLTRKISFLLRGVLYRESSTRVDEARGKGVFGAVPVFSVRVWMSYTELTDCPVPVLIYRTYRSVRYRFWRCTELTEVSGTGIDVVLHLLKCPVPV